MRRLYQWETAWHRSRRKMPSLSSFSPPFLLLLFILSNANSQNDLNDNTLGLTTYGEQCSDRCDHRGFPYTWCHKKPSRNGTWIDRDYCSVSPGVTRYREPCVDSCRVHGGRPFYWCRTRATPRGDWDYCSPFSLDQCMWSTWGSWSSCSASCGSRSTRTRRRRMESGDGRVRHCSGEIEQSIRSCRMPECPSADSIANCQWSEWTEWTDCSVSCGSGGRQSRKRKVLVRETLGGRKCQGDAEQNIRCSADPCNDILTEGDFGETTTYPAVADKTYLGSLVGHHHGVSGRVYSLGQRRVRIEDFHYDGNGPDAFFWVGTDSALPGPKGHILPYPFTGSFYHYESSEAPVLGRFNGESVNLILPPHVELHDIRWVSIWCRRFAVNFGDLILRADDQETTEIEAEAFDNELFETSTTTTTRRPFFARTTTTTTPPPPPPRRHRLQLGTRRPTTLSPFSTTRRSFLPAKPKLPELPRTIEKSRKIISQSITNLKSRQKEKAEESGEDPIPFTVIRVSSSVSQVRPEFKVKDSTTTTTEATTEEIETTTRRRKTPPFLRPLAKFPDIKIPSLATTTTTSKTTTTSTERARNSNENSLPGRIVKPGSFFSTLLSPTTTRRTTFVPRVSRVKTTTTTASTTEAGPRKTSISSDDFRSSVITESTAQTTSTTTESIFSSSISSDVFRKPAADKEQGNKEEEEAVKTTTPAFTTQRTIEEVEETPDPFTTPPPASSIVTTTAATSTTTTTATTSQPTTSKTLSFRERARKILGGRGESRFKASDEIRKLFGRRKNFLNRKTTTTTERPESSSIIKFRSTTPRSSRVIDEDGFSRNESAPPVPFKPSRRPFINRFRTSKAPRTTASTTVRSRFRSTRAPKISTTERPVIASSTFQSSQDNVETSTKRMEDDERIKIMADFMKKEKKGEENLITLDYPIDDEVEATSGEEIEEEVVALAEKPRSSASSGEGKRLGIVVKVPKKITWNPVKTEAEEKPIKPVSATPIPIFSSQNEISPGTSKETSPRIIEAGYNPCEIADACGPNAKCAPRANEPVCSCPSGFSGIPRDGVPDPAHGCVRTPTKCSSDNSTLALISNRNSACPSGNVCVRNFCLPQCKRDKQCSLGERCVNGSCIKICFYDAHCLAGEFCEKGENDSQNGVCLSGCRRDTNCPFGQICVTNKESGKKECIDGCHFNNDCNLKTACVRSKCSDPCVDFTECGPNAVCQVVSHAATCKCPEGYRELNSPYVACVPENINLARIQCLKDSDCEAGLQCREWQCSSSPLRTIGV